MSRRADAAAVAQVAALHLDPRVPQRVSQALLPLITGVLQTKQDMMSFIWSVGHAAVDALLTAEVEAIVGAPGKHRDGREVYRWGTAPTEFPLGGRRVTMACPRVRRRGEDAIGRGGREVRLPSVERFRAADPLPERVLSQILLGVSTRNYEGSLEPLPEELGGHGATKSSASRQLVAITRKKLEEEFTRSLGQVELTAIMIDGVVIARRSAVLALGITTDGSKVPLGVDVGSTENAALCTSLLQSLLDRGLHVDHRLLVVIDGSKGLRRAVEDVFGDLVVIQRCQNHKRRNILQLVPERCHPYVNRMLTDAWTSRLCEDGERDPSASRCVARARRSRQRRRQPEGGSRGDADCGGARPGGSAPCVLRDHERHRERHELRSRRHRERQALAQGRHGQALDRPVVPHGCEALPPREGLQADARSRSGSTVQGGSRH
jgi:transposase-like protein